MASSSSSSTRDSGRPSVFVSMLATMEESMQEVATMRKDLQTDLTMPVPTRRISDEFDETVVISQSEADMDTPLGHIPTRGGAVTEPVSEAQLVSLDSSPRESVQGSASPSSSHSISMTVEQSPSRNEMTGQPMVLSSSSAEESTTVSHPGEGADEDSAFMETLNLLQEELQGVRETIRFHQERPLSPVQVTRVRLDQSPGSESSSNRVEGGARVPEFDGGAIMDRNGLAQSQLRSPTATVAPIEATCTRPASDRPFSSHHSSSSSSSSPPAPLPLYLVRGGASVPSTADSSPPSTVSTSFANSGVHVRTGSLDSVAESPTIVEENREEEYEDDFEEITSEISRSRPASPAAKSATPNISVALDEVLEELVPVEGDLLNFDTPQQRSGVVGAMIESEANGGATLSSSPRGGSAVMSTVGIRQSPRCIQWSAVAASYRQSSPEATVRTHDALTSADPPSVVGGLLGSEGLGSVVHDVLEEAVGTPTPRPSSHQTSGPASSTSPRGATPREVRVGYTERRRATGNLPRPRAVGERETHLEATDKAESSHKKHTAASQYGSIEGIEILASVNRSVLCPTLLNYPCPLCRSPGPVAVPAGHSLESGARDLWMECLPHLRPRKPVVSPLDRFLMKHFKLGPILNGSEEVATELEQACRHWQRGLQAADEAEWTAAIDAYRLSLEALPSRGGFEYVRHWNATLLYHAGGNGQARDRELREWRRVCRLSLPRNKGCRLCRR